MLAASKIKHAFVWLEPPPSTGLVTIANVAETKTAAELKRAVTAWAASAWVAWSVHPNAIKSWASQLPGESFQRNADGAAEFRAGHGIT